MCQKAHGLCWCWVCQVCVQRRKVTVGRTLEQGRNNTTQHHTTPRCTMSPHITPQVLAKDTKKFTMRVGAGMRYTEFLKEAQKAGMSVQVGRGMLLVCVCLWAFPA